MCKKFRKSIRERAKKPVLWRSAFQAHRPSHAFPGTAYPVTIASLCSAFQALNT